MLHRSPRPIIAIALSAFLAACPDPVEPKDQGTWSAVARDLPAALLAVTGTSATDVWAVGADPGTGPLVLHFDGTAWTQKPTGTRGAIWWVHAFESGPVFMGGSQNTLLRYEDGAFTRMNTPGVARHAVFGIWGSSPTNVYAVGSVAGRNGFIWHWDGVAWAEVATPELPELPPAPTGVTGDRPGLFKVWGDKAGNVWVVGARGVALKRPATASGPGGFELVPTNTTATLFTVAGHDGETAIVGGGAEAVLLEGEETLMPRALTNVALLQGVAFGPKKEGWACGENGSIFEKTSKGWTRRDTGLALDIQSLHAIWIDPEGHVWAAGGNVLTASLDKGALIRLAPNQIATWTPPTPPTPDLTCPADLVDTNPTASMARRWDEQILNSIRRDNPRPPIHARNLYHLAAAMWDAWAAYDTTADGVFYTDKHTATDLDAARDEAIAYAAYGIVHGRYRPEIALGAAVSQDCYTKFMAVLGYDPTDETTTGDSPRAVGNRIAKLILESQLDDGSNEANNFADTTGYTQINPPLVVEVPGVTVTDPSIWQHINLAEAETQNGIPVGAGTQGYVGSNWDGVRPFGLPTRATPEDNYFDPGPYPTIDSPEMKDWVVQMITTHAKLDPDWPETIDLSPGAHGNNTLGTNDGTGYAVNPVTGQPYVPNVVALGDYARVLAELWADGPRSETPPGHWNAIANEATDHPLFTFEFMGEGEPLPRLEWDVKMYLTINGAVHDAAVVAWGIKRKSLGARPITIVRYMSQLGQSSDPAGPSYNAGGIPLASGYIEVITEASSAQGQRHEHLRHFIGQIAVLTWRGEPGDRAKEVGSTAWMRGVEWMPYQRRTFVTPPFPGFVSGHSTFSRSAAEALALITGTPFFPGGFAEYVALKEAYLVFEDGPSEDVALQWATYYDAADQAGQSRIWGGIHFEADDFPARILGSQIGESAFAKALSHFDGTAR